jgi:hypothetical protein
VDIITGLALLNQLVGQAAALGGVLQKAHSEGRTELNTEELDILAARDDAADLSFGAAIARAKAEGR